MIQKKITPKTSLDDGGGWGDMDDLDDAAEVGVDIDIKYKIGYYMALIGPLWVVYGGYNLYNEIGNGP